MSSFERNNKIKKGIGAIAGLFAMSAAAFGVAYTAATQVKDNEAAIKVNRGRVVDTKVETGVYLDSLLPKISYKKYPTTLQTKAVAATENDSFTIRTAEKARIYGEFKVKYNIDKSDPQFESIYTLQKAESLADIEDDISDYTIPAAIDIYKTVPTTEVNDNLTEIGKRIAKRLQEILNDRGFSYIKVADVVPTGMGLSPKANADLEQIVSEERKLSLLDAQAATARKAAQIVEDQTEVTSRAIQKLRAAGVPENQIAQVYCLQLQRDTVKIGAQFAAGCFGNSGATAAVNVDAANQNTQAPATKPAESAPAPQ